MFFLFNKYSELDFKFSSRFTSLNKSFNTLASLGHFKLLDIHPHMAMPGGAVCSWSWRLLLELVVGTVFGYENMRIHWVSPG